MSDCRGRDTALLAPGASVENSCDGCQQDITPIEMGRPFIKMREAEENRRDDEAVRRPMRRSNKFCSPAAKEKFFGHGGKEKYQNPAQESVADSRQVAMGMDEAERQAKRDYDREQRRSVPASRFSNHSSANENRSRLRATAGWPEIRTSPHRPKIIHSRRAVRRARRVEPAQVDGQTQHQQDESVAPVAALLGIDGRGSHE